MEVRTLVTSEARPTPRPWNSQLEAPNCKGHRWLFFVKVRTLVTSEAGPVATAVELPIKAEGHRRAPQDDADEELGVVVDEQRQVVGREGSVAVGEEDEEVARVGENNRQRRGGRVGELDGDDRAGSNKRDLRQGTCKRTVLEWSTAQRAAVGALMTWTVTTGLAATREASGRAPARTQRSRCRVFVATHSA